MDLALTNGEKILKSWDYGKLKGFILTKGTYNLTVTNKKIIASYEGRKECNREDFALSEVNGVAVSYKMKRRFIFFKRGELSVSLFSPAREQAIVGIGNINKPGFLSRIPVIGWLFGGGRRKIKVNVNAAQEIVATLSSLVLNSGAAV